MSTYKGKHDGRACVMDFQNHRHYLDFKIEDVCRVDVTIMSGDEVIKFQMRNGNQVWADAGDFVGGRVADFYDGSYTVDLDAGDNRLKWHQRNKVYDALHRRWAERETAEQPA